MGPVADFKLTVQGGRIAVGGAHMTERDRSGGPARPRRRRLAVLLLLGLVASAPGAAAESAPGAAAESAPGAAPGPASAAPITVFAAASLTDAMKTIAQLWARQGHPLPALSFAASSVLAQQVAQGAPADLFLSADETWMDWLAARRPIHAASRGDLVGNTLVLVEPEDALRPVAIGAMLSLAAVLGPNGRLAVGDPASVPAGIYARQALTKLGLWAAVSDRLAPAENVRAALLLVERGEAPAGIVYGSDVAAAPGLAVAGTFPADSHPPIRYPAAVLSGSPEAAAFLTFLHGDAAQAVFRHDGFTTVGVR